MNLEELKLFFESEHRRREELENYALRLREKNLLDELNTMKIQKDKLRDEKQSQQAQLGTLMAQFSERKDIELKAKYEVDEINKSLRQIQKSKLTALEFDKKRELERLAAEREGIKLKEQELLDEMQRLSGSIEM